MNISNEPSTCVSCVLLSEQAGNNEALDLGLD